MLDGQKLVNKLLGEIVFSVDGRKVNVSKGTKTQTVNVRTADGKAGQYDYKIRLRSPFVDEAHLDARGFASVNDLVTYLVASCGGELEKSPDAADLHHPNCSSQLVPNLTDNASFTEWEAAARLQVEEAIDELVTEFIAAPYLHRTEHSIHCRLYELLKLKCLFAATAPLNRWTTQLVHKEWPEFRVRPDKTGRGNFDLTVLSPERIAHSTLSEFLNGRIRPSFVIELGLDDKYNHLDSDIAKFCNSGIVGSYIVHLVRQDVTDDYDYVERTILCCGIRVAYARHTGYGVRRKLVGENAIVEYPRLPENSPPLPQKNHRPLFRQNNAR